MFSQVVACALGFVAMRRRRELGRVHELELAPRALVEAAVGVGIRIVSVWLARGEELEPGRGYRSSDVEVTAVPVRHSGTRGFGDSAHRGACGYVVRTPRHSIYVAGDTGYFSGFVEIGRRFRPDVVLLPIAGYEPAAFREEHMSPLDAVYAFEDLGARVMIPTSYGSFPLSYEPLGAPLEWLQEIMRARGLPVCGAPAQSGAPSPCVAILDHGETVRFGKQRA